jgi:uncharacterized protein YjdB
LKSTESMMIAFGEEKMKRIFNWVLAASLALGALESVPVYAAEGTLQRTDKWEVEFEDDNTQVESENSISILTQEGEMREGSVNGTPENLWLTDAPENSDFTLTVKISGGFSANGQKAGIMVYSSYGNIASVVRRYHTSMNGNVFGMFSYHQAAGETDLQGWKENGITDTKPDQDAWLKLVKKGSKFYGSYSYDNETWSDLELVLDNDSIANDPDMKIGVYAISYYTPLTVTFSDFTVDGETVPFGEYVTGTPDVRSISVPYSSMDVEVGDTVNLEASVLPAAAAANGISWGSSDYDIATVSADGVLTAKKAGTVTIAATSQKKTATFTLNVYDKEEYSSVDLTELDWVTASVAWPATPGTPSINKAVDGGKITIRGTTYDKGFGAHATSSITYNVDQMNAVWFEAVAGLDDGHDGNVNFVVLADDQEIYRRNDVTLQTEALNIKVRIPEGTKRLTLKAENNGSESNDHSAWANPVVLCSGTSGEVAASSITFENTSLILNKGDSKTLEPQILPINAVVKNLTWTSSNASVASVKDGKVTATGTGNAVITVSDGNLSASVTVTVLDPDDATVTQRLCDDDWYKDNLLSAGTGWGAVGVDQGVVNPNTNVPDGGAGVKIAGTSYTHGLCAHAASKIVFDIENMGVVSFSAIAGINGSRDGSVTFKVYADDTLLYESDTVGKSDSKKIEVAVPEGAKTLTLETTDGGDGNTNDHSAWANPTVEVKQSALDSLRRVNVTAPDFLTPKTEDSSAAASLEMTDGSTLANSEAEISFSSSDESVCKVDAATGKLTATGRGTAVITASATYKGITRTASKMITVDDLQGERNWTYSSPEGTVQLNAFLDDSNTLYYSLTTGGKTALETSKLGLNTDLADFTVGLLFESAKAETVTDSYDLISGKTSHVEDKATEITLTFVRGNGVLEVVIRLYEDGAAYRYVVYDAENAADTLQVYSEDGTFAFPENTTYYMMDTNAGRWDHKFNHEGTFAEVAMTAAKARLDAYESSESNTQDSQFYISMPMLAESKDGVWTLITEADLYGDPYTGGFLDPDADGLLYVTIPDQQAYWTGHSEVDTVAPFHSPWRLVITGGLEDIVETNMVTSVSRDPDDEDTYEWVEPGIAAWTWLSEGYAGQSQEEVVRKYIDLAAEMGWSYYILDEGWQPKSTVSGKRYDGYYDWFDDMVDYAAERGVHLIAWILASDLDTEEEREVLKEYAEKGIAGIKVDFFDKDDQDTIALYKDIYEACAENQLIVNCHGANKPTGENRTYPFVINREAVQGQEYGSVSAAQSTYWPFIRNVVGPMDITPRITSSGGTVSYMTANFIMFESGIPCMASSAEDIRAAATYNLLKNLPASWDEIHYIDGTPGDYALLARRSGTTWYTAGINSNNGARTVTFDLDYLEDGKTYKAEIYKDGANSSAVTVESKVVTSEDSLTIAMLSSGGFSIKLSEYDGSTPLESMTLTGGNTSMYTGATKNLTVTLSPADTTQTEYTLSVDDESILSLDGNTVTALKAGTATVTATSTDNPAISAALTLTVVDKADMTELNALIKEADAAVSSSAFALLTTAKQKAISDALDDAKSVQSNSYADQQTVDAAAAALKAALAPLQAKQADTSILSFMVSMIESEDLDSYANNDAKKELETALANAKAELSSPTSQAAVDAAASALNEASLKVRKKADSSTLAALQEFISWLDSVKDEEQTVEVAEVSARMIKLASAMSAGIAAQSLDQETAVQLLASAAELKNSYLELSAASITPEAPAESVIPAADPADSLEEIKAPEESAEVLKPGNAETEKAIESALENTAENKAPETAETLAPAADNSAAEKSISISEKTTVDVSEKNSTAESTKESTAEKTSTKASVKTGVTAGIYIALLAGAAALLALMRKRRSE